MDALKRAKQRLRISVVVTLAVAVLNIATFLCWLDVRLSGQDRVQFADGAMTINNNPVPSFGSTHERWNMVLRPIPFDWDFRLLLPRYQVYTTTSPPRIGFIPILPLWPLLLPSSIIAFRAHRTVRRLSLAGCKHCGYSRAGLAVGVPCPECGAAA